MARNTSRGRTLLSLAVTLPIAVLAGYVILEVFINYVMGFLTGSSALDDLMVGHAYLIASFLLGLILTVLNWRKVDALIARYGIPGIVSADDGNPADAKEESGSRAGCFDLAFRHGEEPRQIRATQSVRRSIRH